MCWSPAPQSQHTQLSALVMPASSSLLPALCPGLVISNRSGEFSSPAFPQPYPKLSRCTYRVHLQEGFRITLDFVESFEVEAHPETQCPYDSLQVKSLGTLALFEPVLVSPAQPPPFCTCPNSTQVHHSEGQGRPSQDPWWIPGLLFQIQTDHGEAFGPFCGNTLPHQIVTNSSAVTVTFVTDESGDHTGWKIRYSSTGEQPELRLGAAAVPPQNAGAMCGLPGAGTSGTRPKSPCTLPSFPPACLHVSEVAGIQTEIRGAEPGEGGGCPRTTGSYPPSSLFSHLVIYTAWLRPPVHSCWHARMDTEYRRHGPHGGSPQASGTNMARAVWQAKP